MDAELKAKWVAALRSGKYRQTQSALRNGDSYCCLGVLCDVVRPDKWRPSDTHALDRDGEGFLSCSALNLVGMTEGQQVYLAMLNDDGKSFSEIADEIERTL